MPSSRGGQEELLPGPSRRLPGAGPLAADARPRPRFRPLPPCRGPRLHARGLGPPRRSPWPGHRL